MKVIIAGSRDIIVSVEKMDEIIKASGFEVTEVVSGTCRGVDISGETWAESNKIPIKPFPADWDKYFGRAGMIRNSKMAVYGETLIAIPHPTGSGTQDMIAKMRAAKKPVFVWRLDE